MGQLNDKIATVTGSDAVIGQGIAEAFAREGAEVAITDLHDEDGANETRRRVEALGQRAVTTRRDQADTASNGRAVQSGTIPDQVHIPAIG